MSKRTSTLYITGLDVSVTDKALRDECAKFGAIKRVTIIKDKETRTSKGFGYLLFRSERDATAALKELDGRVIADKPVKVKYSFSETPEWQMILDSRRQQQGPPGSRGRGRGSDRGQGRGQGRGQPPRMREENGYERTPSARGGPGPRGRGAAPGRGGQMSRGGPPTRGAPTGRGMSRGPPRYEREELGYGDERSVPETQARYRDPYEREPAYRTAPAPRPVDPYERLPPRYDSVDPDPVRDGRAVAQDVRQVGRIPGVASRPTISRNDYDPYGAPQAQDIYSTREPVRRDPYAPVERSRADPYADDRYGDRLTASVRTERVPYEGGLTQERQIPVDPYANAARDPYASTARDPYANSRKRPAQGYAGYDDVYDQQPPSRVARPAPTGGYGY